MTLNLCQEGNMNKLELFKRKIVFLPKCKTDRFIIIDKWFSNGNKNFSIINYKKVWKEVGNKPRIHFSTNGARKRSGDKCLDISLTIGYIIINYTNFDLQGDVKNGKI